MALGLKSGYVARHQPTPGPKEGLPSVAEPAPLFDIVIAGGGASGLALAAAIRQAMREGASIAVVDPAPLPAASATPLRTVAIAEGPRRLLDRLGAWEAIEPRAQAILSMAIMDGGVGDAVRL